jgi:glycosyltransferase involved in cell wall biosynthesis
LEKDNTSTPKVSVCVVTYNQEHYLRECLLSILTQETSFDFEVIVGDDCSTDGTRAIISEMTALYPHRMKPLLHEKNIGPFPNLIATHNMATGKYVCHCDGDDLFLPGKLQRQADYLDEHPGCSVVWHKMHMFDDEGRTASEYILDSADSEGLKVTADFLLRNGTVAAHSSIMYRKSARQTIFPAFHTLDLFYSIEYLLSGYGIVLNDVLGKYRVNAIGSIGKNRLQARRLIVHHWNYYLHKVPQYRKQILIFAMIHFLVDCKNRRSTSLGFLKLIFRAAGTFSISELIESFKLTKYLRIPSVFLKN